MSIKYPNDFILPSGSKLYVIINETLDTNVKLHNNVSNIITLKPLYNCKTNQYFNQSQNGCFDKLFIDYDWQYSEDVANVIFIKFTEMNLNLVDFLKNWMLMFHLRNLRLSIDYTNSLLIDFDTKTVNFTINSKDSLIGGIILDVTVNQGLYSTYNSLNTSIFLNQRNFSIKLFDYYVLSSQTKAL